MMGAWRGTARSQRLRAVRPGRIAQPVNAATSAAYFAAGCVVVWRYWDRAPDRRPEVVVFAKLLGLMAVGSLAYHGPQGHRSKPLHDWPIPVLLGVIGITPLVRQRGGSAPLPIWTRARRAPLAVTAAFAGLAYLAGRTGSPVCDPDCPMQLHGAWHVLSAAAFVQVADILYGEGRPG